MYAAGCVVTFVITAYLYFSAEARSEARTGLRQWICPAGVEAEGSSIRANLDRIEQDTIRLSAAHMSIAKTAKLPQKGAPSWEVNLYTRRTEPSGRSEGTSASYWRMVLSLGGPDERYGGVVVTPSTGELRVANTRKFFPYDKYFVEIVSNMEDRVTETVVPTLLGIKSNLDKSYVVTRFDNYGDFLRSQGGHPVRAEGRATAQNECLFLVERAAWLKWGVAGLVILLFAPVLFTLYRPEENPGLELITTVVYVGLIRAYLLDSKHAMDFYVLDFAFLLVIVLVAVIPAVRLSFALPKSSNEAATG